MELFAFVVSKLRALVLTAVEEVVRNALNEPELELVAVNLPDEKKGEKVILMIVKEVQLTDVKKAMLDADANPLMIPAAVLVVEEIPKLGSGKTDFKLAKKMILEMIE